MEEWNIIKAYDYCYNVTDGTHDSPKQTEFGKYLITSKHIKDNRIDFESAYKISEDDYNKIITRSKVDQWDIIISMIGAYCGFCCIESSKQTDYAIKNVGLLKVGNELKCKWLYYYLTSPHGKQQLSKLRSGSSQPYISLGALRNLDIPVPNENTMSDIVSVLSSLDSKIELNRRINDNLEQQAQALYKSWFVDFEPFKGEKFVDSELGKIPEGWRVGKIGNYCKVRSGYAFKSSWWTDKGCKVIKIKNITEESKLDLNNCSHVLESNTIKASDFMVSAGDVLIAMTGATIGKFCIVPYLQNNTYVNQRVGKFFLGNDPIKKLPFLYNTLKQGKVLSEIISKGQGSAQPNISGLDIENISIIQPTNELIQSFNALLIPLYLLMLKNEQENIVLANKRDSLLPKLMSGELKTGDLHR